MASEFLDPADAVDQSPAWRDERGEAAEEAATSIPRLVSSLQSRPRSRNFWRYPWTTPARLSNCPPSEVFEQVADGHRLELGA
jgi:hypothetical protein